MRVLLGAVLCLAGIAALAMLVFNTAAGAEPVIELAGGKTRPQGGIYAGCYTQPRDLNPFTTADLVAQRVVLQFTHEALLDWNPSSGELRPALAESYERGADDRTWVFTIRDGVRFADGSPLTMEDVLFPVEVSQRGKLALGNIGAALDLIEHAEARGRRLHLRLREPGLSALSTVATGYLVPKRGFFMISATLTFSPNSSNVRSSVTAAIWAFLANSSKGNSSASSSN